MSPVIGLVLLVVGVLLAFPLFAIAGRISRNRRTNSDPELQAEADRVFEAEIADIPEKRRDA